MSEKLCGKITSLPRKKKNRKSVPKGKILVTRGKMAGTEVAFAIGSDFDFTLTPFLKLRMLVCLNGEWDNKKKTFYVYDIEDITRELTAQDLVALSILAPGLTSFVSDVADTLGISRIGELIEALLDSNNNAREAEFVLSLAEEAGKELDTEIAVILTKIIKDVTRDKDSLDIYRLIRQSCTSLDFPQAVLINDCLHLRATRNKSTVAQLIKENPWILVQVFGEDIMADAKQLAKKFGKDFDVDECRAKIMAILFRDARHGHSYTPLNHIYRELLGKFSWDTISKAMDVISKNSDNDFERKMRKVHGYFVPETKKYAEELTEDLINNGLNEEKATKESKTVLLPRVYFGEKGIAEKVVKVLFTPGIELDAELLKVGMTRWARENEGIELSEDQLAIADAVTSNKIVVVSGQAGSGKTTAVKAFVHTLQDVLGERVPVLAPTGTAAQRAGAEVGADFATIHRWASIAIGDDDLFISYNYDKNQDGEMEMEYVPVMVVDEMSMSTVTMMYRLLDSLSPKTRFLFIGDTGQLPPLGPGGVFQTFIELGQKNIEQIKLVELPKNYRSEDAVIDFALRVRNKLPLDRENSRVVVMDDVGSEKEVVNRVVDIVKDLIDKGVSMKDIVVLAPTRTKGVCTDHLNNALKKIFGNENHQDADIDFSVDDPVIAIKNDYQDAKIPKGISKARRRALVDLLNFRIKERPTIFNGTRGIVVEVDDEKIVVDYNTPEGKMRACYTMEEVKHYIELAYAATVHKMQGGQGKYVIFASTTKIRRDLLYTAITRCKEMAWLVGPAGVWDELIEPERIRTKLKYRILEQIELFKNPPLKPLDSLDDLDDYDGFNDVGQIGL